MTHVKKTDLKNFALLYFGQTISQLGSSMTGFATVIWAYKEYGQVMASSLLALCSMIPYIILSILGGAVVDRADKKKVMLVCDTIAAIGSLLIMICFFSGCLKLWILCIVNIVNGFMNAFQAPASQVAVSLLIDKKDYAHIGGLQSSVGAVTGIITPIMSAALLSFGGLGLVVSIDLTTFIIAFLSLALFVNIPDTVIKESKNYFKELLKSINEGISFMKHERGILLMLVLYSVLEFMGAVSFDSMYSPLLLARTNNNEMVVGIVSSFMAAGCLAASILITVLKPPKKKIPVMCAGSIMCLLGIMLFGIGRNIYWWCGVVFFGCFGAPIYQTYQTVILRERVPVDMQGRIFSIQGMITQLMAPAGYLSGAVLADYLLEPFMEKTGNMQSICSLIVGSGKGSGIGLIFVAAGFAGIIILMVLYHNRAVRQLDGVCNV